MILTAPVLMSAIHQPTPVDQDRIAVMEQKMLVKNAMMEIQMIAMGVKTTVLWELAPTKSTHHIGIAAAAVVVATLSQWILM